METCNLSNQFSPYNFLWNKFHCHSSMLWWFQHTRQTRHQHKIIIIINLAFYYSNVLPFCYSKKQTTEHENESRYLMKKEKPCLCVCWSWKTERLKIKKERILNQKQRFQGKIKRTHFRFLSFSPIKLLSLQSMLLLRSFLPENDGALSFSL